MQILEGRNSGSGVGVRFSVEARALVLPEGFNITQRKPLNGRPVWRILNSATKLVVYEIWHGPNGDPGFIEGVLSWSKFGLEIRTAVSFPVSMVELSMEARLRLREPRSDVSNQ